MVTCTPVWWKTSRVVTDATRQKRLHLVALMCMIGEPGILSLFHLITEDRLRCHAVTVNEADDDGEEEGESRKGWRTVAFPRVTDEQEIRDKLFSPSTSFKGEPPEASLENVFSSRNPSVLTANQLTMLKIHSATEVITLYTHPTHIPRLSNKNLHLEITYYIC